jgi:superfamily II DNA or RNA helicase
MNMDRRLDTLDLDIEYRSGENNLVADFYRPCLSVAHRYDRASGYFRSSVMLAIGMSLLDFVKRGGRIRLICSPDLTEAELQAFEQGYRSREELIESALLRELDEIFRDPALAFQAGAIATFIAIGSMDVRIAFSENNQGIYHEKLGIFFDENSNIVSFKGSANESWNAWHERGNHESFDVFRSWVETGELARVERHVAYFERLWRGHVSGLDVQPFPDVAIEQIRQHAKAALEDLNMPITAGSRTLLPHQDKALSDWRRNGRRGIIEHATGSGKTFTALSAVSEHLQNGDPALVLVPSQLLFAQWQNEIQTEIPSAVILGAGAGRTVWRQPGRIESFTANDRSLGQRIILSTMQTARSAEFSRRVRGGEHLLLVADEVHRTGSTENRQLFEMIAGARLGLSATPRRYGDPDGTAAIFSYFGGIVGDVFTLRDAIAAKRLCPYEYHSHLLSLDEHETEKWAIETKKIQRLLARSAPADQSMTLGNMPGEVKMLLIQRARIAKQASRKIDLAVSVLTENFEPGQSWLVYCDDSSQLSAVIAALTIKGLPVNEYHTGMGGDPEQTMRWYRRHGGILVSIKCLDEGVDIPEVSHALILASSQNPREYIQRRGRVLRVPPPPTTKVVAVVHDALVITPSLEQEREQLSLVKSEIARALEFAEGALNRNAKIRLLELTVNLGLDIARVADTGVEEDTDAEQ